MSNYNKHSFDWFKDLVKAQQYMNNQAKGVVSFRHILKAKPSKEQIREKFFADRWIADNVVDQAMIKMREV